MQAVGLKLSAMEAARLSNRGERTIRRWIATGQLVARLAGVRERSQGVGPYRWLINVDDLLKMPGVTVNRMVLAEVEERAALAEPGTNVLARVERIEQALARLQAQVAEHADLIARLQTEGEGEHTAGAITIG